MADSQKIIIDNVDGINLSAAKDTAKNKLTRKVSITANIDDEQAHLIDRLLGLNAAWSVQLTVLSKQLPMGEDKD